MSQTFRRSISKTAVFLTQHPEVIMFCLLLAALAIALIGAQISTALPTAGPATGGTGGTG